MNNNFTEFDNIMYSTIGQNIRLTFCENIIKNHHGQIIKQKQKNSFICELPNICARV